MRLGSLVKPELIFPQLPGPDRPAVLRALAERMEAASLVEDADDLYRRLWEREKLGSTAIGAGVAVPHCKMRRLDRILLAIGLCPKGVDFETEDGAPVRLVFLVVSPENAPADHLQSLAAISRWVKADHHVERILKLKEPEAIYQLLQEEGAE